MCGIAGRVNFCGTPISGGLIHAMCDALAHRGPDDSGLTLQGPVGLGNRRLSIVDLAGGHQPLCNEDATIWIVFNGEIYNFREMRAALLARGHVLRTQSDTEVIVHLYEEYGVDCVQHLDGMFAFAVWDAPRRRLFLARDRLGEKPLVYALAAGGLTFASEIQALLCDPAVPRELDLTALDLYLTFLYVPAPRTIFKAIHKLPPAHYLVCESGQVRVERYWQVDFRHKTRLSEEEAAAQITDLLRASVRRRLIADVPVGAFLSGGLDSATVVALMSQAAASPVSTFSVGFEGGELANDDLPYARQVAERYATQHHELWVCPRMADVLPDLVRHYGEPFGDGSAIPSFYISQAARRHVKVALGGDGGDELFGGYGWYAEIAAFNPAREARGVWRDGAARAVDCLRVRRPRQALAALKGSAAWTWHLGRMARDPVRRYGQFVAYYTGATRRDVYSPDVWRSLHHLEPLRPLYDRAADAAGCTDLDHAFFLDHTTYLPDDILAKVDIASMACSLETRPPFLDYHLVEAAAALPASAKLQDGQTKRLLRKVAAPWLPPAILDRPKVGFGLPMRRWLQGPLYPLAADLLLDATFRRRGIFSPAAVARMLSAHREGVADYGHQLYQLLVFELWARTFLDAAPPTGGIAG